MRTTRSRHSTALIVTETCALVALLGAVALVGVVNLTGFLVVVATARQKETGIRVALGASRGARLRQLLTESILWGASASIIGLGVSAALLPVLERMVELPTGTHMVCHAFVLRVPHCDSNDQLHSGWTRACQIRCQVQR